MALIAFADADNTFTGWQGCNVVYGPENIYCNVSMTSNKNVNATFAPIPRYNLTVNRIGAGDGYVFSSDTIISCPTICNYTYLPNTNVTLTAYPDFGSTFVNWTGCNSVFGPGNSLCNVTMTSDKNVIANFSTTSAVRQFQIKLWQEGVVNGTVTSTSVPDNGNQFNCGSNCDYQTRIFNNGTNVSLLFTSPVNYYVAYYLGCDNLYQDHNPSTWNRCNVTLYVNRTVYVSFEKPTLELYKKSAASSGTVTSNPSGINCGLTCQEDYFDYNFNSVVTLIANPSSGYSTSWTGCGVVYGLGNNLCNVTMNDWKTVNVTFTLSSFNFNLSNNGSRTVIQGSNVTNIINATLISGATQAVSFLAYGLPPGTTASFIPTSCNPTCSTILNLTTSASTPVGTYTIYVNGTSGGLTNTTSFTLTVNQLNYNLTLNKKGTGTGTVNSTSIPSQVNQIGCGAICLNQNVSFKVNANVTLNATASPGNTFAGWVGCNSVYGPGNILCNVTMNSAKTVNATFNIQQFTLTTSVIGSGNITGNGISCLTGSTGDCSETVNTGTLIALTATPLEGWTFVEWGGGCSGTGSCVVTMDASKSVSATFSNSISIYTVNVAKAGTGNGIINSTPTGINCPGVCTYSFETFQTVLLNATAMSGSSFVSWTGCPVENGNLCTVNRTNNPTLLTANFIDNSFNFGLSNLGTRKVIRGNSNTTLINATLITGTPQSVSFLAYGLPAGVSANFTPASCTPNTVCSTNLTLSTSVPSVSGTYTIYVNGTSGLVTKTTTFALNITQGYVLTVNKTGIYTGMVNSTTGGINCGSTCSRGFAPNTPVVLNAYPDSVPGFSIMSWSGCSASNPTLCSITSMNSDKNPVWEYTKECGQDSECSNNLYCDGAETCNLGNGHCQLGTAPNINDNIACTVDSCDEANDRINHTSNNALCSNGLFCDGSESCSTTQGCQDSADPCSAGLTCDEQTDICENVVCNTGADTAPYGDCDGVIESNEITNYINGYYAGNVNINDLSNALGVYL